MPTKYPKKPFKPQLAQTWFAPSKTHHVHGVECFNADGMQTCRKGLPRRAKLAPAPPRPDVAEPRSWTPQVRAAAEAALDVAKDALLADPDPGDLRLFLWMVASVQLRRPLGDTPLQSQQALLYVWQQLYG